nr:PREDICTED: ER membrane protein complex subunit 1 isoform X1 [Bemisia tabaci]
MIVGIDLFKSALIACLLLQVYCLYEDQVSKFDWKKTLIGSPKFARIVDHGSNKQLFLASKENVLASIDFNSGNIKWRHVLEKDPLGNIKLLHMEKVVITVTGTSSFLIRGWQPNTGFLDFQWSLPRPAIPNLKDVLFWAQNNRLYQLVLLTKGNIEVGIFNILSGTKIKPSYTIPLTWIPHVSSCSISNGVLLCASESGALNAVTFLDHDLKHFTGSLPHGEYTVNAVSSSVIPAFMAVQPLTRKKLLITVDSVQIVVQPTVIPYESDTSIHSLSPGKFVAAQVTQQGKNLVVTGSVLESDEKLTELSKTFSLPTSIAGASLPAAHCIVERAKTISCDLIVSTVDDTIVYINTSGPKISWYREEGLASIVNVQLIDLGVSEEEAAIEKEFNNKEFDGGVSSSFLSMFYRRISSQLHQLQSFVFMFCGMLDQPNKLGATNLVRDKFGLHKIIVAVSKVGKLFGIDNLTGTILWTYLVKDVVPFSLSDKSQTIPLYVQRTTRHFPHPAVCTVIFQDAITRNGVLFSFNPITGEPLGDGILKLSYRIQQTLMLHQKDEENLNGILLLSDNKQVHAYPSSTLKTAIMVAPSTYFFIANPSTGLVTGFAVSKMPNKGLIAQTIWEVNVGKEIVSVEGKNPLERVHSQGRVLSDRSVLYKYINPNLITVTTHHPDPVHKSIVNLWLIDAVSGAVAFSTSHKRATPPVHVIHSENWVVYSFFNEKFRRTEIATLELYEGKNQRNTTAFTASEAALIAPQVGKQAYILPASVEKMRETITEKGITSKHVLVALSSGGILEIPWPFLDPRRPPVATPEMREEGVIPYIPELPIPSEAIINYNQTSFRLRGIHTIPSGLESTSLVLAYGLDIFYTRISPSKTFDLLKEDFDYFLIMVVLSGLSLAAYATKHLAGRKALKQAWK